MFFRQHTLQNALREARGPFSNALFSVTSADPGATGDGSYGSVSKYSAGNMAHCDVALESLTSSIGAWATYRDVRRGGPHLFVTRLGGYDGMAALWFKGINEFNPSQFSYKATVILYHTFIDDGGDGNHVNDDYGSESGTLDVTLGLYLSDGTQVAASAQTVFVTYEGRFELRTYRKIEVDFNEWDLEGKFAAFLTEGRYRASDNEGNALHLRMSWSFGSSTYYTGNTARMAKVDVSVSGYKDGHPAVDENSDIIYESVYVLQASLEQMTKPLNVGSSLNVDGALRARSIRYSTPITGYQTVGPADVSQLQNEEYGTFFGHRGGADGQCADNSTEDIHGRVHYQTGEQEGRDVGLLPLWFIADRQMPANIDDWGGFQADSSLAELYHLIEDEWVGPGNGRYGGTYFGGMASDATFGGVDHLHYKTSIGKLSDGHVSDRDHELNVLPRDYPEPQTFVRWYRPIYDKGAFFKKGAHSAAIVVFHPYYDPLFYHEMSDFPGRWPGAYLPHADRPDNTGSYVDFQNSDDSTKINPDAFVPPGRTGFLIPLDPPHGSMLTTLSFNVSLRPNYARYSEEYASAWTRSFNVWRKQPDGIERRPGKMDRSEWHDRNDWSNCEGFIVRLWRYNSVDFGQGMWENDHYSGEKDHLPEAGFGELLVEYDVDLSTVSEGSKPEMFSENDLSTKEYFVKRGIDLRKALSGQSDGRAESALVADRTQYSYYATIEFWAGPRQTVTNDPSDGNSMEGKKNETWTPGMSRKQHDGNQFRPKNQEWFHGPHQWTPAFPGQWPKSVSGGGHIRAVEEDPHYGEPNDATNVRFEQVYDPAVRWMGLLHPRMTNSAAIDGRKPQAHLDEGDRAANGVPTTVDSIEEYRSHEMGFNSNLAAPTRVPSHEWWPSVVKFRGMRLGWTTDRGGDGWG